MTQPSEMAEAWLAHAIDSTATSWSVGTFGALAEFSYALRDPVTKVSAGGRYTISTNAGALRFKVPSEARLFAYEGLSKLPEYWSQGLSLCLPEATATLTGRTSLTRIGADTDAIRDTDKDGVLVDLGIGSPHIEACVRINDENLLRDLERWFGKPLFTAVHAAAEILYAASPHRVFRSAAARIEVYGPIPSLDGYYT